jgi:hypothetical protein
MQKHNKNKNSFMHGHHIRIGSVAIAIASGCYISGATHMSTKISSLSHEVGMVNVAHSYQQAIERENETARHIIRVDGGLRLPSTSGSSL